MNAWAVRRPGRHGKHLLRARRALISDVAPAFLTVVVPPTPSSIRWKVIGDSERLLTYRNKTSS